MTYERWDVVVVGYPFIEGLEAKKRPALIVSSDHLHTTHNVYWMAMITTAAAGHRPEDIPISDHKKAGLPENCVVRLPRLTTLSDVQILYRRGPSRPGIATLSRPCSGSICLDRSGLARRPRYRRCPSVGPSGVRRRSGRRRR